MQTPVHSCRRALAGVVALLAALATLVLPVVPGRGRAPGRPVRPGHPRHRGHNVSVPAGGTTTATVTNLGGVPSAASVSAVAANVVANQPAGAGWLQAYRRATARSLDGNLYTPWTRPPGPTIWTAASPYGWWDEPVLADGVLYYAPWLGSWARATCAPSTRPPAPTCGPSPAARPPVPPRT
jgi:hypothetical protein